MNKRKSESSNNGFPKKNKMGPFILKQLIPEMVAGAIIGPKGGTMSRLRKESNVYIKLSQNKDYFPGTSHRVLVMSGEVEEVYKMNKLVWELLTEREWTIKPMEMRLVVTNLMVGVIMGHNATSLKAMQVETGCKIFMSARQDGNRMSERIINIVVVDNDSQTSEVERIMKSFDLIFAAMRHEEDCTANCNESYCDRAEHERPAPKQLFPRQDRGTKGPPQFQNRRKLFAPVQAPFFGDDALESVGLMLRGVGYAEDSIVEIITAIRVLIKYQFLPTFSLSTPITLNKIFSIVDASMH